MIAGSTRIRLFAAFITSAVVSNAGAATTITYISPQIAPAAPGSTNAAIVEIQNSSSHGRTVHLLTGVPGYGGIKSRFRVWVPPKSSLRWTYPIMLPSLKLQKFSAIPISASISGGGEAVRGNQFIQNQRMRTAVVEGRHPNGIADIAAAMRRQMGLSKEMTYLTVNRFPLTAPPLLSIKRMYIGSAKSQMSGPQVQALRDWVLAGGRLWMNLDNATDRHLAQAVLGGRYDLAYVQTIRSAGYSYTVRARPRIVKMARSRTLRCYFPGRSQVVVSADGWPMVMRYSLGRGQVWLNAMNWHALLTPRGTAISELWPATRDFFAAPARSRVPALALQMAANAIGYRVASRESVLLVFAGLLALVAIGGWVMGRQGKGGLVGAFALAAAIVASGTLYALGRIERGPVPESESTVQLAVSSGKHSYITGQAALFAPEQINTSAHVSAPGLTRWNRFLNSQRNCRFDYSPNQAFIHVRHLIIPSGKVVDVRYAAFRRTATPQLAVQAVITRSGFAGRLLSKYHIDHAILGGPGGLMALQFSRVSGNQSFFTSGDGQILPAGQYMSGVLLSRSDQREEALTAALLAAHPAHQPELLVWSGTMPAAWSLSKTQLRLCDTLIVLPFLPRLPAAGHSVLIPWPMVRLRIVRGPQGQMSAPVYNFDRRRWIAHMTISGRVYMDYSVPVGLRHIDATQAHLEFDIAAPGRRVSLAVHRGSGWVPVRTLTGGRGVINQMFHLQPGEFSNGHLLLRLHVGFPKQPSTSWHFVYGRVSFRGRAE
jgi:hypothetical protein